MTSNNTIRLLIIILGFSVVGVLIFSHKTTIESVQGHTRAIITVKRDISTHTDSLLHEIVSQQMAIEGLRDQNIKLNRSYQDKIETLETANSRLNATIKLLSDSVSKLNHQLDISPINERIKQFD